MSSQQANLHSQLFGFPFKQQYNTPKQSIFIDLQMDCQQNVINQHFIHLGTTSNLFSRNQNSLILKNEDPQQLSFKELERRQKGFAFQNGQSKDLPAFLRRDTYLSHFNLQKQQRVKVNQESTSIQFRNLSFPCQPMSTVMGNRSDTQSNTLNRPYKQLRSLFPDSSKSPTIVEDQQENNEQKIQSAQKFETNSKKGAQKKQNQRSVRKSRINKKKEKTNDFSNQIYFSSSSLSKELLKNATYRYKIPQVSKKISDLHKEVMKDLTFKIQHAAIVEPYPSISINKRQQIREVYRKKMEKRRIIQIE